MMPDAVPPADQNARDAAVAERARNVVIDAGAGTGKTSIVVSRLVEMVAPRDDARAGISLRRIAAMTFTRRAAGELRLRIREKLLVLLSGSDLSAVRRQRLSTALSELDSAYVGTIHSFADRLLRMRPMEARVSPAYEIAENTEELVQETFDQLMHCTERGTLAERARGTPAEPYAQIAESALRDAQRVGLRPETLELEHYSLFGLDALVRGFIDTRDVKVVIATPPPLDLEALRASMRALIDAVKLVDPTSVGGARLHAICEGFEALLTESDPVHLYTEIIALLDRHANSGHKWRLGDEFNKDAAGFAAGKLLQDCKTGPSVRDQLKQILGAWLGPRLLHVQPVAIELYEQVKRRHQVADQVDLLIKLRDLLRDDLTSRAFYQERFDHIFVDEFQDTDPLQAEIVVYLCEAAPSAATWQTAKLARGKLTIVGDPKQSIYRFRRADVEMYDRARALITSNSDACLEVELEANFRAREPLIRWLNDRYDAVLGVSPDGSRFDPATGVIYNRHLSPGRVGVFAESVHVVSFELPAGDGKVDEYRALEGEAMAHYLKWLVEESGIEIDDPLTKHERPLNYGDIAVLCLVTTKLDYLFPQLDKLDLPYAARGATLFLRDPLHQQFLLGLRALADRDDGIAEAALLRPPFFAVDPLDLVLERHAPKDAVPEDAESPVARVRAARELLRSLRRNRFSQSPGATARDLLEKTAIGSTIAVGPNGLQRLDRLRELCLILGQRAVEQSLDYDAISARLRDWIDHPVQLDPPHPVGSDAIQIMTVHQAKGLEFPVVVLWDGSAAWSDVEHRVPLRAARDASAWAMTLDKLDCEVPEGTGLKQREGLYRRAERRRAVYVLGTRARDILVLPKAGDPSKYICGTLLASAPAGTTVVRTAYLAEGEHKWWLHEAGKTRATLPPQLTPDLDARWLRAASTAQQAHLAPLAVSSYAHDSGSAGRPSGSTAQSEAEAEDTLSGAPSMGEDEQGAPPAKPGKPRVGRYGSTFGTTVHRALELLLVGHRDSPRAALQRAIAETGLAEHHEQALADIERTLATLEAEKLLPSPGHARSVALEYPIAGRSPDGQMLLGIIDFLSSDGKRVDVLDFKTDEPPQRDVTQTHAQYVRQAQCYGQMLAAAKIEVGRTGLLFTADGQIHWIQP